MLGFQMSQKTNVQCHEVLTGAQENNTDERKNNKEMNEQFATVSALNVTAK